MKKLSVFNWRELIEVETPPCLSIVLNTDRVNGNGWQDRLQDMIPSAEALLKKTYGSRAENVLRIRRELDTFLKKEPWIFGQTLGIFISPEVSGFASFSKPFPELCIVSDSFHIKPFIYNNWQRPTFGIYSKSNSHSFYLVDDHEISPLGNFKDSKDFLSRFPVPQHSTFLFAGNPTRIMFTSRHFKEMREKAYKIVDLGPISIDGFFDELPLVVQAQRENEDRRFLSHFSSSQIPSPDVISHKLSQSQVNGYFASHVLSPLWGKASNDRAQIDLYEAQKDGKDDCVVDDLFEVAIRKGMKTLMIESHKWKFPTPFLLKTENNNERKRKDIA